MGFFNIHPYVGISRMDIMFNQGIMTDSIRQILFDVSLFQINGILNEYSKIPDLIFVNDKEDCLIKRCDSISTPEDRFHQTIELNIYVLAEVR